MLEIILLIFLTRKIAAIAVRKGLSGGRWKLYLVLAWLAGEIIGVFAGIMIFGSDNIFSAMITGLAGAFGAYFIILNYLTRLPDILSDDDLNNIGR